MEDENNVTTNRCREILYFLILALRVSILVFTMEVVCNIIQTEFKTLRK